MTIHRITPVVALAALFLSAISLHAADVPKPAKSKPAVSAVPIPITELKRNKPVDFEAEVLPVLRRNCIACHNRTKSENHLILETPQTIAKGGDSGDVVMPKHALDSLLLKAAAHLDDPTMPPPGNNVKAAPLTPDELGLLKLWIDQGAGGQVSGSAAPLKWQPLPPSVRPILAVAVTSDGQLAACGRGNEIFVYHIGSGALAARLVDPALMERSGTNAPGVAHLDLVQSLAFDPTGDLLASGGFREVKLWRRPHNVRTAELIGASDAVRAVAVSPDGRRAATSEAGGAIRIWDLPGGKLLQTLAGHTAAVTGLRFSADGAKLYSGSLDKSIRVWNAADGKPAGQIDTPAPINAITLAASGAQICSAHADNVIRVWELAGLKPLKELKGHTAAVSALDILPSGLEIISGSDDGTVRGWNLDSGQPTRQFAQGGPVTAIAVRADGKRIASAGANSVVKLWNAENNRPIADLKGDSRAAATVERLQRAANVARDKADDQKRLVTEAEQTAKQETEAIQTAKDAKAVAEKSLAKITAAAKVLADEKAAIAKEAETAATAAKVAAQKATDAKAAAAKDPKNADLAKAADAAKRAADEADKKLADAKRRVDESLKPETNPKIVAKTDVKTAQKVVDNAARDIETAEQAAKKAADAVPVAKKAADDSAAAQKLAEAAVVTGTKQAADAEKPFRTLAFSPDNLYLAAGGDGRFVQTWAADNGAPAEVLEGQGAAVAALAWTPDSGKILSAADKSVVLWNSQPPWSLERTIGSPDDPKKLADRVIALDFSPDGKLLATGGGEPSRNGELKLWNPADGSLVRAIADAHTDTIFGVRFSPDGGLLASCGADRFVRVWFTATGKLDKPLEGHTQHVLGVAWRPDGKLLASCGADNVVKIWDVAAGEQKRTIEGFGKEVTSIDFVANTPRVLSTCGDHQVRLANIDNGQIEKTYGGAADYLYSLAVTPDGKLALAGGQTGVLRVWNVETTQEVRHFDPPK